MTDISDPTLTFAVKLDRLFNVCRSRDQPEQSAEEVARSVSHIIGRSVTGSQISALRHESAPTPEQDIARGLATHFGVSAEYLTSAGAHAEHVDKQLRLLAAARDAGVKRLSLRGEPAIDTLGNIVCDDQLSAPTTAE
ncbi:hypothetical protein [Mycobacterium attenuatum]|uniref:hypothetical protein n=1 Tax=Mycobacterium attenuatum TaxID=2341086 RepID=UPI000F139BA0|nr:hypothetical protein [Mycobacterium attenuatum]VBA59714.1 Nucleoid-associated protein EspR [Mycobacterium attenuatum]